MAKICQAPANLGRAIALVAERQDGVVVRLSDGVSVPQTRHARAVGGENALVRNRVECLEPRKKGRSEVEADLVEVVDDALDPREAVENSREGVGAITFVENSLVPVVKRTNAGVALDAPGPRVFARRLIEMPVNDDLGHERGELACSPRRRRSEAFPLHLTTARSLRSFDALVGHAPSLSHGE